MADSTKLESLGVFKMGTPDSPINRLARGVSASSTILYFEEAISDDNIIIGVRTDRYTELVYLPSGSLSVDGKTAENVARGILPSGTDFTIGDIACAQAHSQGAMVSNVISPQIINMILKSIKGEIATGSNRFVVGREQDEHVYYAVKTTGGVIDILRRNSNGTIEWSADNGLSWNDMGQTGAHGDSANVSAHAQVDSSADSPADSSLLAGDTATGTWKKMDYKNAFPTAKTPDATPANDEDKIVLLGADGKINQGFENVSDDAYDATTWDGDFSASSKNAIRDKFESMSATEVIASDNIIAEANTYRMDDSGNWVKFKEIEVKTDGTYRVVFSARAYDSGTVRTVIYKNDVAYGTERSTTTTWATFSEDLQFSSGDKIELYGTSEYQASRQVQVQDFKIKGDLKSKSSVLLD